MTPGDDPIPLTIDPAPADGSPLTADHHLALEEAARRKAPLDRAAAVAKFNGWTTGVIAALSAPFALSDPVSLVVVACLGVVAFNEFAGRSQLRRLDPRGPRRLMLNQAAFAVLLIVYSVWQITRALTGPSPYEAYLADPKLARMLRPIGDLHQTFALAVYGCLIVVAIIFQGGTALFYRRRVALVRAYLQQTPAWIVAIQFGPDVARSAVSRTTRTPATPPPLPLDRRRRAG